MVQLNTNQMGWHVAPGCCGRHAGSVCLQFRINPQQCHQQSTPHIVQVGAPVLSSDTEESLCDRIREAKHQASPAALELVASGTVTLGEDGPIT